MSLELKSLLVTCSVLLLSACSSPSSLELLEPGVCTQKQKTLVSDHIGAQIDALFKKNWPDAYSYAGDLFKTSISLEQFEKIIIEEYQMLINNKSYKFDSCIIEELGITQRVSVTDSSSQYLLEYKLTVTDRVIGIMAATIISQTDQLNA